MSILLVALAPVIVILVYVYVRDKYEKEPLGLLFKAFAFGALTVIPVLFVEGVFESRGAGLDGYSQVAHKAFVVAAFTEEIFKFFVLYLAVWKSHEFNERFDGIIYAVFVSMGFATVENILYVTSYGHSTGLYRAFTAVPGHALFAVAMGYYFALARFSAKHRSRNILLALFVPVALHGIYDFILFSQHPIMLLLFVPFLIYLWRAGFKKMKEHLDNSRFRT